MLDYFQIWAILNKVPAFLILVSTSWTSDHQIIKPMVSLVFLNLWNMFYMCLYAHRVGEIVHNFPSQRQNKNEQFWPHLLLCSKAHHRLAWGHVYWTVQLSVPGPTSIPPTFVLPSEPESLLNTSMLWEERRKHIGEGKEKINIDCYLLCCFTSDIPLKLW